MSFIMYFSAYAAFQIYDIIHFLETNHDSHIVLMNPDRIFIYIKISVLIFKQFIAACFVIDQQLLKFNWEWGIHNTFSD